MLFLLLQASLFKKNSWNYKIFAELILPLIQEKCSTFNWYSFCEFERTQILQSLALAVLKIPYAGYLLSGNRSIFIDYDGNILWYYTCTKKVSPLYVFEDKRCYKRIPILSKKKYILLIHSLDEHTYGIKQYHVDRKIATTLYS